MEESFYLTTNGLLLQSHCLPIQLKEYDEYTNGLLHT